MGNKATTRAAMSGLEHLRRLALQLAVQSPEDDREAHYVLDVARDLIVQVTPVLTTIWMALSISGRRMPVS